MSMHGESSDFVVKMDIDKSSDFSKDSNKLQLPWVEKYRPQRFVASNYFIA